MPQSGSVRRNKALTGAVLTGDIVNTNPNSNANSGTDMLRASGGSVSPASCGCEKNISGCGITGGASVGPDKGAYAAGYMDDGRIFQYAVLSSSEIPFSQSVVEACRQNKCGRYGTCWTCPPGVGDPEELEARIKSYSTAAVFTCKYELEDSFDIEGMSRGAVTTQRILLEKAELLRKDGADFMVLGCEGCILCEKCSYPDAPCRFPDKAIPSVEACGINVVELAAKSGLRYNNGPCTVTYFCLILIR